MNKVNINNNLCVKNHWCPVIKICPVGAITQSSIHDAPIVDENKCIGCGKCVKLCPYKAFQYNSQN